MHNQGELNLACFPDTVLAPAQYPQTASIPANNFLCHRRIYITMTQSVIKPKKDLYFRGAMRESRERKTRLPLAALSLEHGNLNGLGFFVSA